MKYFSRLLVLFGLALLCEPSTVRATPYDDAADGNWSTPATWGVGSGFPGTLAVDTALINQTRSITVDVSPTFDNLTVTGNAVQTLSAGSAQTITVNEFFSGNVNNFIIDTNVTLDLNTTGTYQTRGGTINGTFNVLGGATLTYTNSQAQNGSGAINVATGGKIDMQSNSFYNQFDGATGLTLDNDGLFEFNNSGSFRIQALNVTGDGQWHVNSGGGTFNNVAQTISLNPSSATITGSAGLIKFDNVANTTHSLGSFNMSGTNIVEFADSVSATYQVNGPSTFQDMTLSSGDVVDLAPTGGGSQTHAVNGTLSLRAGSLTASDGAGAILNVNDLSGLTSTTAIGSGVTLNLSGTAPLTGNGNTTLNGELKILNGASASIATRETFGSGQITVDDGGSLELTGVANANRKIDPDVVNNGLITSVTNNIRPLNGAISGTGTFRADDGTLDVDNGTVTGWSGSGTFASQATWHARGTAGDVGIIDFAGSNNSIDTIGSDATMIVEDDGVILQLSGSARNNLTVEGELQVRGTADLLFNAGQGVTVASGGTLGGDGAISGIVTVQDGGRIGPGQSPGTLDINDNLLLSDTSQLDFELDMSGIVGLGTNDLITVTGDLTLDGQLLITNLGNYGVGNYRLIDYTGILTDNTLEILSSPGGFLAEIDTSVANQVNLIVTSAVPEPASLFLLGLGVLGLMSRRRDRRR